MDLPPRVLELKPLVASTKGTEALSSQIRALEWADLLNPFETPSNAFNQAAMFRTPRSTVSLVEFFLPPAPRSTTCVANTLTSHESTHFTSVADKTRAIKNKTVTPAGGLAVQ